MMEIRRRKREICNKIHNSTWVIETLGLLIATIFQLLALRADPYLANSISELIGVFITRLLVPFTCLFAESRIKVIVLKRGWIAAIKTALKFKHVASIIPFDDNRGAMPHGKEQPVTPPVNQPCVKDLHIFAIGNANSSVKRNILAPTISVAKNLSPSDNSSFSLNHLPNSIPDKF